MKSVITYFTGGANYGIPNALAFEYCIRQLRFIFISYLITYYFQAEYTIVIMASAMVLADLRFYIDFDEYMALQNQPEVSEDETTEE